MSGTLSLFDLTQIPPPDVVETLDFETILAAELDDLRARFTAAGLDYSATVESDPAYKLLEVASYREVLVRQRLNDVARRRLLAFAAGGDLDQLAAFYGVQRMLVTPADPSAVPPTAAVYEDDARFRSRVRDRIAGSSAAGSAAWYRYYAKSASGQVKDVAVDSPSGGIVRVSVLSREGNGTPSAQTLAAVAAVVQSDSVRGVCNTVQVTPASIVAFSVSATLRVLPSAPADVLATQEAALRNAFASSVGLGWDVTCSWLTACLQGVGVYDVALAQPATNVAIAPNECAALGTVSLTNGGTAA